MARIKVVVLLCMICCYVYAGNDSDNDPVSLLLLQQSYSFKKELEACLTRTRLSTDEKRKILASSREHKIKMLVHRRLTESMSCHECPLEQLMSELAKVAKKGDIEAKLLLRHASHHLLLQKCLNEYSNAQALEEIPDLPAQSGLPLSQRQRLKQLHRQGFFSKKDPNFSLITCQEIYHYYDEFTLYTDKSKTTSHMMLALLLSEKEELYSFPTNISVEELQYCSIIYIPISDNKSIGKVETCLLDFLQGQGMDQNIEIFIRRALERLYWLVSASYLSNEAGEFIKLSQCISDAYNLLKTKIAVDGKDWGEDDYKCAAMRILYAAKTLLDYHLGPMQKHVDDQIIKVTDRLSEFGEKASRTRSNWDSMMPLLVCDDLIGETAKQDLNTVLPSGIIDHLTFADTCKLLKHANDNNATKIKYLCLLNLLIGIRLDLFDEGELILLRESSLAYPELKAALEKPVRS